VSQSKSAYSDCRLGIRRWLKATPFSAADANGAGRQRPWHRQKHAAKRSSGAGADASSRHLPDEAGHLSARELTETHCIDRSPVSRSAVPHRADAVSSRRSSRAESP
jgi:hypothetical protein